MRQIPSGREGPETAPCGPLRVVCVDSRAPMSCGSKTEALRRSRDVGFSATGGKSACSGPSVGNTAGKYLTGNWWPLIPCDVRRRQSVGHRLGTIRAPRVERKFQSGDSPETDRYAAQPGVRIRCSIVSVSSGELWCTSRWRPFLPTVQLILDPERGGYTRSRAR